LQIHFIASRKLQDEEYFADAGFYEFHEAYHLFKFTMNVKCKKKHIFFIAIEKRGKNLSAEKHFQKWKMKNNNSGEKRGVYL